MNRAAVIEQIKAAQETLSKLLAFLESSEADKFVAHLYASRKQYRVVCECLNKGATRQLERKQSQAKMTDHFWQSSDCIGSITVAP
jgi:hypothetical protein